MKFSVFADFHYARNRYATVEHLDKVIEKAKNANVDCIIHGGDFCNDYAHSPEILNELYNCGLDFYGCYGNHDTEGKDDYMSFVSQYMTNDKNAVWGTKDGKIGDGNTGYFYADNGKFRIICVDTNHYYDCETGELVRTATGLNMAPIQHKVRNCLGEAQLEWLEKVIDDASDKDMHCIVVSHAGFSGLEGWEFAGASCDAQKVRDIFNRANKKKKNTVIMSVNGHYHTDHLDMLDGMVYFDVNTLACGFWWVDKEPHYSDEHTFDDYIYDEKGNAVSKITTKLTDIVFGDQTWYFSEPLSAIVEIDDDLNVKVEGMECDWIFGIAPTDTKGVSGVGPYISTKEFSLK
ncbi:MAG: metallophosphoesterase [Acutalibacteraceae bacterium]|nr:metallophosphoesterase [Acutalibacteraceae bacterium]